MTTLLFSHAACLEHDTGDMHPERPARLAAVIDALDDPAFASLDRRQSPPADTAVIARVHSRRYIDAVLAAVPEDGLVRLDPDTVISPRSGEAALRAAGAAVAAVDAVMAGEGANAFCAVRPPGHHAEPSRAMGFCLFNNVAIGAAHARASHGLDRIAVVDFDVHHGNGTQAMFWDDPDLFFTSTHQSPLYPGTGGREERGAGNIFNVPMQPMAGSAEFRTAITDEVLPALEAFQPELLLISAGFDAHAADPLAQLNYTTEDFGWVTEALTAVAARCCNGRIVSTLEGGYDLEALAASVGAHVGALMAA